MDKGTGTVHCILPYLLMTHLQQKLMRAEQPNLLTLKSKNQRPCLFNDHHPLFILPLIYSKCIGTLYDNLLRVTSSKRDLVRLVHVC